MGQGIPAIQRNRQFYNTYGQDPDLLNVISKLYQRIDFVLASKGIDALWARRVGNTPLSRIGGLWPSDHAGVVATLRP